jgi:hypothetical protein
VKLSDVMSATGLAGYAEAGLVLFLFAFALVAFDVVRRGRALETHAWLPLDGVQKRVSPRALGADAAREPAPEKQS